jgi:hypothetical protein
MRAPLHWAMAPASSAAMHAVPFTSAQSFSVLHVFVHTPQTHARGPH